MARPLRVEYPGAFSAVPISSMGLKKRLLRSVPRKGRFRSLAS